MQCRK